MKVLMLGRIGLLGNGGGDKVQIENTAKELTNLGVEVDIKTGLDVDLSPYDLIHVFQLDWTSETYFYARKAKKAGKPLILSPIHHSVKEVALFDETYAFDFRRLSRSLLKKQHSRDTFKNVYRSFFDLRKFLPTLKSIFIGLKRMHKRTLEMSDVVLVQTELEAQDLKETYDVEIDWVKIPNGVGRQFREKTDFSNPFSDEEFKDYVLCVGRIEPRKNQLNIIKAMEMVREELGEDIKLVFIGRKTHRRHYEYTYKFNKKLQELSWIKHISQVPYEQMPSYYHFAKVGVSASWFETTGLTSLEAIFCGANAVASGDRAKEYLGDKAFYCRPDSVESIRDAVIEAYRAPALEINQEMKRAYTWENAAAQTLEVYKNSLK